MKKTLAKTFQILALLIALSLPVFTQTNDSSTATASPAPPNRTETVIKTDETISFLLIQNENAREIIQKQKTRIKDLETENALEQENSASISKSYETAKIEIASLKQSNEALFRAVATNEQTIALLQSDNTKQREKAKNANKAKWKAYAVAAGVVALKFLIP